jgi:hypothetical protein
MRVAKLLMAAFATTSNPALGQQALDNAAALHADNIHTAYTWKGPQ